MIELVQALHSRSVPSNYDQATEVAQSRTLFMAMAVVGTVMTMAGLFIAYNWVRARPLLSEVMHRISLGIWALVCLVMAIAAWVGGVGILLHNRDTLDHAASGVVSVFVGAALSWMVFNLIRTLFKPLARRAAPPS